MRLAKSTITLLIAAAMLHPPPVAMAANQTLTGIHYLIPTGKKAKQVKARLVLGESSVQVFGERGATLLKEIPYSEIKAATYSRSKHPRWKTMAVTAAAVGLFALPLVFMKAKKHWLTLQAEENQMALRLSKKNFALVINAVEEQLGVPVERIAE